MSGVFGLYGTPCAGCTRPARCHDLRTGITHHMDGKGCRTQPPSRPQDGHHDHTGEASL